MDFKGRGNAKPKALPLFSQNTHSKPFFIFIVDQAFNFMDAAAAMLGNAKMVG